MAHALLFYAAAAAYILAAGKLFARLRKEPGREPALALRWSLWVFGAASLGIMPLFPETMPLGRFARAWAIMALLVHLHICLHLGIVVGALAIARSLR